MKALSPTKKDQLYNSQLGPFLLSLSLSHSFFFLSFPTEPGYLIFLRRSRCHLPLMVETMGKSSRPECGALLNASGRFEEGSWKSVFQPVLVAPCRSFCAMAGMPPGRSHQRWFRIKESEWRLSSERPRFKSHLGVKRIIRFILRASVFLSVK